MDATQVFPMVAGNMPGFKWAPPHPSSCARLTTVFGIPVIAPCSVLDTNLQHVASVLADWLDSDLDGCVDNELEHEKVAKLSFIVSKTVSSF